VASFIEVENHRSKESEIVRKLGLKVATAIGTGAVGVLLLTSSPAFAAYNYQYLDNGAGYGHVDGNYISACDTKSDNQGVVTQYTWDSGVGQAQPSSIVDTNGNGGGCGSTVKAGPITSMRVCLRHPGSSTIQYCQDWLHF
jgi:hypothetical protein